MKPTTTLRVKRLDPRAELPARASAGAACWDLKALFGADNLNAQAYGIGVFPGRPVMVKTGLAVEVPAGHVLLIFSRSGHGFNHSVRLSNCVGVIDSDYRGELMVRLTADDRGGLDVKHGDRIAQAMLVELPAVELEEVDALSSTERGTKGFGSTGA